MLSDDEIDVEVRSTAEIPYLPEDLDLLVLGAPTQAHGVEAKMRAFLDGLPPSRLDHLRVAVFDTRMRWPKLLSGSAAEGMAKILTRYGATMVDGPESFFVEDKEGPLREGEADRAADWGWFLLSEMRIHA